MYFLNTFMCKFKLGGVRKLFHRIGELFPWIPSRLIMQQTLNHLEVDIDKVGLMLGT